MLVGTISSVAIVDVIGAWRQKRYKRSFFFHFFHFKLLLLLPEWTILKKNNNIIIKWWVGQQSVYKIRDVIEYDVTICQFYVSTNELNFKYI